MQTINIQFNFKIQIKHTFNSIEYPFLGVSLVGLVGLHPPYFEEGVVTRKTFPYFELILEKMNQPF